MFLTFEVKFITRAEVDLAYCDPMNPGNWDKFPYIVMNGINIPENIDHQLWWENIGKKTVQAQLSSLRNDRLKECKWSYYGKTNVWQNVLDFCFTNISIYIYLE